MDRQTLRYVGFEDPGVLIAFSSGVGRIWPGDGNGAFSFFVFLFWSCLCSRGLVIGSFKPQISLVDLGTIV